MVSCPRNRGNSIGLYADVIVSRVGRVLVMMIAADTFSPFDEAQGAELVAAMAERAAGEQARAPAADAATTAP